MIHRPSKHCAAAQQLLQLQGPCATHGSGLALLPDVCTSCARLGFPESIVSAPKQPTVCALCALSLAAGPETQAAPGGTHLRV